MVYQLKLNFNETHAIWNSKINIGIIKIFNEIEVRLNILIKIAILPSTQ